MLQRNKWTPAQLLVYRSVGNVADQNCCRIQGCERNRRLRQSKFRLPPNGREVELYR